MLWRLIFQSVPVVAWCAACLFAVRPLELSRPRSLAAAAAFAVAFGKFAFFSLAGGDGFTPELPAAAIWLYGWAYAAAMALVAAAVAFAAADGALRIFGVRVGVRARRLRMAALAALAAALAAWGVFEGVRTPCVRRLEIPCQGLPQSFDGYRIVHLSDLHCSTAARRGRFERIVGRVNALEADLVAITGDFVDGEVSRRREDLEPLSRLRARDGVLGCTGNHERYWDWPGWGAALRSWGVGFPEESGARTVRRGGDAISIGGIRDPAFGEYSPADAPKATAKAFAGAPDGAFRILLSHRPYTETTGSAAADVRLQLSGHTHGGAMPGIGLLVSYTNEGHLRGLYEFAKGRFLHVSPGTGQWAGFPIRLFNSTEITELTLRPAGAGQTGQ